MIQKNILPQKLYIYIYIYVCVYVENMKQQERIKSTHS